MVTIRRSRHYQIELCVCELVRVCAFASSLKQLFETRKEKKDHYELEKHKERTKKKMFSYNIITITAALININSAILLAFFA